MDEAQKTELIMDVAREMYPDYSADECCHEWQFNHAKRVVDVMLGHLTEQGFL